MSHNGRKTAKAELPMDGVKARFSLCHKLREIGKNEVPSLCSCDHGQGTDLTHPLGHSQDQQETVFLDKSRKDARSKDSKGGPVKALRTMSTFHEGALQSGRGFALNKP